MPQGIIVYASNNRAGCIVRNNGQQVGMLLETPARLQSIGEGQIAQELKFKRSWAQADRARRLKVRRGTNSTGTGQIYTALEPTPAEVIIGTIDLGQPPAVYLTEQRDSQGSFQLDADNMKRYHALPNHLVQPFLNVHDDMDLGHGTKEESRESFFEAIDRAISGCSSYLDFFAYSGHGTKTSLVSAGVSTTEGFNSLIGRIRNYVKQDGIVILYCCLSGSLNASFAQKLSTALPGMKVYGHYTSAHSSQNPNVTLHVNGRGWLVPNDGDLFGVWSQELLSGRPAVGHIPLRYRFPFMEMSDLESELRQLLLP